MSDSAVAAGHLAERAAVDAAPTAEAAVGASAGQLACLIFFVAITALWAYAEVLHARKRKQAHRESDGGKSHKEDGLRLDVEVAPGDAAGGGPGRLSPRASAAAHADAPAPEEDALAALSAARPVSPVHAPSPHATWRTLAKLASLEPAALLQSRLSLRAWAELGLVLLLFYVCDRTALLPNGGKSYSRDFFIFLCLAIFLAGALSSMHEPKTATLLNRDQTEEWKGWMQVMFLLYHYFEAREMYNAIRIFIAGYVWMTGFGNFSYYYVRADFSAGRFAQMMWRLNFFVFFACVALRNDYVLYYICPMHTLFTLAIYGALGCGVAANRTNWGVAAKVALCCVAVVAIWDIPGVFHAIFTPFKWLVGYVDPRKPDVEPLYEWYFRSGLDRYVWIYGMLCAYCHPACERALDRLDALKPGTRGAARVAVLLACLVVGGVWHAHVYTLPKLEYNKLHPYTSWIPLSLWVVLRNLFPALRGVYLELFAYLGKITLETYISQFHIWLHSGVPNGQPTKLLVLVSGYPLVNFFFCTALYVAVSKRMFDVTNTLKNACVPLHDNKLLASNAAAGAAIACSLWLLGFGLAAL